MGALPAGDELTIRFSVAPAGCLALGAGSRDGRQSRRSQTISILPAVEAIPPTGQKLGNDGGHQGASVNTAAAESTLSLAPSIESEARARSRARGLLGARRPKATITITGSPRARSPESSAPEDEATPM